MSMTLTIEIPALDRLCAILENRDKADLVQAIKEETVAKLKDAVESGVPRPVFQEVKDDPDDPWKNETAPEPQNTASEPPKPEPAAVSTQAEAPKPTAAPAQSVTLDAVQRAAAQMRDEGKLKAVTDTFPEFEIKKLSDLKGDKLQKFGERLRKMGAKI